jgi:hypothetical protein
VSLVSDLRTYAGTAVAQGRRLVGSTVSTTVNTAQAVGRAARRDPRLAKVLSRAEAVAGTVSERVVKPVQEWTGIGTPSGTGKATTPPTVASVPPVSPAPASPGVPAAPAVPADSPANSAADSGAGSTSGGALDRAPDVP